MKEKGNNSSSREWIAVYQLLLVVSNAENIDFLYFKTLSNPLWLITKIRALSIAKKVHKLFKLKHFLFFFIREVLIILLFLQIGQLIHTTK